MEAEANGYRIVVGAIVYCHRYGPCDRIPHFCGMTFETGASSRG